MVNLIKENLNEKNIQNKILRNEDIFNRGFELKKIKIDESYPDYILKNRINFLNGLFKKWCAG